MNTTYIFHGFYSLSKENVEILWPKLVLSEFRFEQQQQQKKTLRFLAQIELDIFSMEIELSAGAEVNAVCAKWKTNQSRSPEQFRGGKSWKETRDKF